MPSNTTVAAPDGVREGVQGEVLRRGAVASGASQKRGMNESAKGSMDVSCAQVQRIDEVRRGPEVTRHAQRTR